MEFLKRIYIVILIIGISFGNMKSQDKSNVIKAFESSYTYEKAGTYNKAAEVIKNVYDENSYGINLRMGWLLYLSGSFNESMTYYQRAMKLMPYSEEAKFGLVLPASALGKWDIVANLYKKVLEVSANNTIALYKLGMIYYGQANYTKANECFSKLINLYPFGYDGLIMMAWTNFKLGKMSEAKILFTKVLMLSPNDASALEGLGYIK
jgi:tetratricopeptide (TPR) repeat protein